MDNGSHRRCLSAVVHPFTGLHLFAFPPDAPPRKHIAAKSLATTLLKPPSSIWCVMIADTAAFGHCSSVWKARATNTQVDRGGFPTSFLTLISVFVSVSGRCTKSLSYSLPREAQPTAGWHFTYHDVQYCSYDVGGTREEDFEGSSSVEEKPKAQANVASTSRPS